MISSSLRDGQARGAASLIATSPDPQVVDGLASGTLPALTGLEKDLAVGLQKNSQAKLATEVDELVSNFGRLPIGDVRYHAGDLPNGGAVNLNHSSWATNQMLYTASADPVWLRKWIEIPKTINGYDPIGASPRFGSASSHAEV